MDEFKVLMIDDDEVIAQTTAEYFNMFDVKTAFVTNYDDAVAFLEKNMVSLLLLDINLGDRSGFDLCKKVREDYDMPIFFISARTSDDDVLIALNIGGDDYIKKPYTLSILLAKVKSTLARYEREAKAAEKRYGWISGTYWMLVTAGYLAWSFIAGSWDRSWIVWPIAGVLYGAIYGILRALNRREG